MKKILVVFLIAILCFSTSSFANHDNGNGNSQDNHGEPGPVGPQGPAGEDGEDGQDGIDGVNGTNGKDGINGTNAEHNDWGYGVGADIVVFKSNNPIFEEVTIEPRYDIENEETRVFAVVRVDLWEALQNR